MFIPPFADAVAHATVALAAVTAALAVGTFVLAWITHKGNKGARRAEANLLTASFRPVLVPFQRSGEYIGYRGGSVLAGTGPQISENPPGRSDVPRYSAALLPVENVGNGPALKVRGTYTGPSGEGEAPFPTEAIGAGERGIVAFENWAGATLNYEGHQSVSAVIEYDDMAGQTYRTEVIFDAGNNAYRAALRPGPGQSRVT